MALIKPSWLRNLLSRLNWDIFTWKVYIGDAIEGAIDWVIDWLNYLIKLAQGAWDFIVTVRDWVVDLWNELVKFINKEVQKVWNSISTWLADLTEWWNAQVTTIRGWIDEAKGWLLDRINDVARNLNSLAARWDNFWTTTWQQLVRDFNSLVTNVSNFFTLTLPTLASKLFVGTAFNDFRLEWSTLFNFWGEFWRDVCDFFAEPFDWLLTKFTDWFLGPEK